MSTATLSDRKIQANRLNAQRSTGPRTPAGKARSSANALIHGLRASTAVLPGEDAQEYDQLRQGLLLSLNPRSMLELQLSDRIICACWKLQRLQRAEQQVYAQQAETSHQIARQPLAQQVAQLERELRYAQERRVNRRTQAECEQAQLRLTQAQEELERPRPDPDPADLLSGMLKNGQPACEALDRLHRYEQQLDHSMLRWIKQLEQMQKRELPQPGEFVQQLLGLQDEAAEEHPAQEAHDPEPNEPTEGCNSSEDEELATDELPIHTEENADDLTKVDPEQSPNAHGVAVGAELVLLSTV